MQKKVSEKKLRQFGFLIRLGFPFFVGFILPGIFGHHFRIWTLFVGIPFLFIGIISPKSLFYPFQAWMALGHALGWINSKIILGFVFFMILFPISLIMRCFGYDPLRKKKENNISYRENKEGYKIELTKIF